MNESPKLSTTHLIRRTGPTTGRQFTVPVDILAGPLDGVEAWFQAQPDEAGAAVTMEPVETPAP